MTTALTEQELAYLAQVYALEARTHDPTSPAAQRAAMIVRLVDEVRIHRGASDEEREPLREVLRAQSVVPPSWCQVCLQTHACACPQG